MYSASLVVNAICVCSLDAHVMGHPTNDMMYPVWDFAALTSFMDVALFQFPQKSTSAYLKGFAVIWIEDYSLLAR
jgi:hypothetical protein